MNATFARMPARAASANLRRTDWAVLHVIALHADKKGRAFPSMETIAAIIGINRSNVPRALNHLERSGLLRRHRVRRGAGGWQVNNYELVYEPFPDVITGDDTARAEDVITLDDRCHHQRRQSVIIHDALTDHLTDQGTDYLPEGRVSVGGGNRRGVITHDDKGVDRGGVGSLLRSERLLSGKPNGVIERARA